MIHVIPCRSAYSHFHTEDDRWALAAAFAAASAACVNATDSLLATFLNRLLFPPLLLLLLLLLLLTLLVLFLPLLLLPFRPRALDWDNVEEEELAFFPLSFADVPAAPSLPDAPVPPVEDPEYKNDDDETDDAADDEDDDGVSRLFR